MLTCNPHQVVSGSDCSETGSSPMLENLVSPLFTSHNLPRKEKTCHVKLQFCFGKHSLKLMKKNESKKVFLYIFNYFR